MKTKMIKSFTIFASVLFLSSAYAEESDKNSSSEVKEKMETVNNENLINKIETAQKEQFLKFMQKKKEII